MTPFEPARNPPEDPIRGHPTRAEQLDILASLVGDLAAPGDALLDLGIGAGYVAGLILDSAPDVRITGIDINGEALEKARAALAPRARGLELIEANLESVDAVVLPAGAFRFAVSVLTFHDLPDDGKRAVITWAAERLAPGGHFLLLDRIRLPGRAQFPLQAAIWRRIERVYGSAMRSAEDYDAYLADLEAKNRPANFDDYMTWLAQAGLAPACLHLHGNIALFTGTKNEAGGGP
jgi:tRNA (cmo5U34)-methyltransferase